MGNHSLILTQVFVCTQCLSSFSSPFNAAPYSLMEIVGNCCIHITYEHKAKRNIDLSRKNIDRSKIENDNDDPIRNCFDY